MAWLARIFRRKQFRSELAEEIGAHIDARTDELIAAGRPPQDAAREARRAFGQPTLAMERSSEVWQFRWIEALWADLRLAVHRLAKTPSYTVIAVLTLAVGIGATTAIFTIIDQAMLRSLPVERPSQLVSLGFSSHEQGVVLGGLPWLAANYVRDHATSFSGLTKWSGSMVSVSDDAGSLRSIPGAMLEGNAFTLLGVHALHGRLLQASDDVPGGPEGGWPLVLSYDFWQANYHGDAAILGKHVKVSGQVATVVGILPRDFHGIFVGITDTLYLPAHFLSVIASSPAADPFLHPEHMGALTLARLAPHVTIARANVELAALSTNVVHQFIPPPMLPMLAQHHATLTAASAERGFSFVARDYKQQLYVLQAIVLLVLLLCCVNLGGLQLARLQTHQREYALRAALGASRYRMLQQSLVESLFIALAGSLVAAGIAWASTAAIARFLTPPGSVSTYQIEPDAQVLLVTTALAVATSLFFGLIPALMAGRISPASVLKSQGTNRRSNLLRRRVLVPGQFALALVLVFAAGLFSATLKHLRSNHAGFDASHVMMVTAQFQTLRKTPAEVAQLYRVMTDALRTRLGVTSATYTWYTPLTGNAAKFTAHSASGHQQDHAMTFNEVGDRYFTTIGTAMLTGREFAPGDRDRTVCILNQSAARTLFPGGMAMGETVQGKPDDDTYKTDCRVVGIVEDARYASLREAAPATIYFPASAATVGRGGFSNNLVFLIRSARETDAIAAYRAVLATYAPETAIMRFLPLQEQVDDSLGSERLISTLSTAFGAVALVLSGIGIFGLLTLRVEERTQEIGVRIALGARRKQLVSMVLREAMAMVASGAAVGIVLAAVGTTFVRHMLYGLTVANVPVAVISLALLFMVALVAVSVPARRAAWLDPMVALRKE